MIVGKWSAGECWKEEFPLSFLSLSHSVPLFFSYSLFFFLLSLLTTPLFLYLGENFEQMYEILPKLKKNGKEQITEPMPKPKKVFFVRDFWRAKKKWAFGAIDEEAYRYESVAPIHSSGGAKGGTIGS